MVFSNNLIPFFDICSVDLLAVFQPGCSGICYFATLLGPLRGRNSCCLWFWQLVFGVWLRDATSNLPSSPNPLSNRSVLHDHDGRKHTWESIHTRKTVVFFTIQRSPRISTSYKFAAPRYRLPCRLYRWASNLTFNGMERSLSRAVIIKTKVSAHLRYHVSNSVVFNQLLLMQPTTNAKWSLNRRDNNSLTTLEDADSTQFYWWLDKSGG